MENNERLLIVEDEIFAQAFLYQTLQNFGYKNIFVADNANDAISYCKTNKIDLTFMDINIKGDIDGIQCARELSLYHDVPIVFTTAYEDRQTIDEASDTNLFGYLIKPFTQKDISIILKVIQRQLFSKNKVSNKKTLTQNTFYNFDTKSLTIDDHKITLTKNETLLIELLINTKGSLVPFDKLRNNVWHKNISDSGIRDAIARLRKKVPTLPITTHFGSGYSLDIE